MLNDQLAPTPQFPPWMPPGVRPQPAGQTLASLAQHMNPPAAYPQQRIQPVPNISQQQVAKPAKCPEIVWRQTRWPATEAGSLARMPCPSHALSGLTLDEQEKAGSSFACLPNGRWTMRVHSLHCQSMWLRNLTQRVEVGESPLAALGELAQRTRSTGGGGLFGADLAQIGRIVRRFVSQDLNDWLLRISDDKQRISFGRDTIQVSSNEMEKRTRATTFCIVNITIDHYHANNRNQTDDLFFSSLSSGRIKLQIAT